MARLTCAAASAGAQLLVETHSDHVLNGVRLAVKQDLLSAEEVVLHFFHRGQRPVDPGGVRDVSISTPTIGPDGMISHWPEGFFDEWDRSLDRLLD